MKQFIYDYIDAHRDEVIEDWKNLVNLEGSLREPENMYIVADFVNAKFQDAGVDTKITSFDKNIPPVVTGIIGADRPGQPILFSGHFDTVFNKGTFGDNPFRIEGEKAYGPGVLDMKGGIIIALWVIKALEAAGYNERPIKIAFCGDEEGGTTHHLAAGLIKEFAEGCRAGFNMETGPINNSLCVGRKWISEFEFTVHGITAHSGNNYEVGRNAVVEAAKKIVAIQELTDMEKDTHMNVAIVNGGQMINQVPDTCTVRGSCRYKFKDEIDRVRGAIDEILSAPTIDGVSIEFSNSPARMGFEESEANLALWAFVRDICVENGVPEVGHVFLGGGSDACSVAEASVPVLCSCGVRGEWNHTDREYAVVESMFERAKLWADVVLAIENFKI